MAENVEKKGHQHQFVKTWAMGMNDYEIAKEIGVKIETIRSVKNDLAKADR